MKNLFLVEPCKEYQRSFENYVSAYRKLNDKHYLNKYKKALEDFDEYLRNLSDYSMGINLAPGHVAYSTFWIIGDTEVVGVTRIRHQEAEYAGHIGYDISQDHRNKVYGTKILKLALEKAAEIGLEEVIIACNTDNTASKKVIENNGGRLLDVVYDKEENEHLYRYIISL